MSFLNRREELSVPSLPRGVDQDWYGVGVCRCRPANARDKGLSLVSADADRIRLVSNTLGSDIDVVIPCGKIIPRRKAYSDVVVASCIMNERIGPVGRVEVAGNIVNESKRSIRRVVAADSIVRERGSSVAHVVAAGSVAEQHSISGGCVEGALCVAKKGERSIGRVGIAGCVA